jgi:ribosomal-protein-alanine N-acetyltransferase
MPVVLEALSAKRKAEFLAAVRRSRRLHSSWVRPPATPRAFAQFLRRARSKTHAGFFVCLTTGELVGVVNLNEIVMGSFRSAYPGYYAFVPYNARGHMKHGLRLVIRTGFKELRLHRVEANVQPGNRASRALVRSLGLKLEGFSPRYLKIAGRWRDHERWAITVEEWKPKGAGRRS